MTDDSEITGEEAAADRTVPAVEGDPATRYDVRGNAPTVECDYCGRPFETEALLALHHGHVHRDALTEADRERFEETYAAENRALRRYRLKALGALVVLYFGILMVYAVVI